LVTLSKIKAGRLEKVIPDRIGGDDHASSAIASDHDGLDLIRKGYVLRKPDSLATV
jgi:hypothetical protein